MHFLKKIVADPTKIRSWEIAVHYQVCLTLAVLIPIAVPCRSGVICSQSWRNSFWRMVNHAWNWPLLRFDLRYNLTTEMAHSRLCYSSRRSVAHCWLATDGYKRKIIYSMCRLNIGICEHYVLTEYLYLQTL